MSDSKRFQWMIDIGNRIANHATFGVIPVCTEYPAIRSLNNGFTQQVKRMTDWITGYNGKSGLGIWINMPHMEVMPSTQNDLRWHLVTEITVLESIRYNANPTTGFAPNGVGLHADDVADDLALNLQNWRSQSVADACRVRTIYDDHEGWIPPDLRSGTEQFDTVGSRFQIQALADTSLPARCFPPIISFGGGNCTITCATSGVTILYTTDGSYPTKDDAETYSAPFAVDSGDVVLAVATKASNDDSDLGRATAP